MPAAARAAILLSMSAENPAADEDATRRSYSAMIGRQFGVALNQPRRGTDYLSPDHPAFRRI
jgi:hypothetical protein